MKIEPIGFLQTCFGSKFAVPRQPGLCPSAWGILEFTPQYRALEAVRGLDGFSHVWLVFGFHQTSTAGWHPTVRPPRLGGNERVGVFASRSTYRPNGLGLSLVKLDAVETSPENGISAPFLRVSGVDLVDGTPVYDIKPYLAYAESIPDAKSGYAAAAIPKLTIGIDAAALADFQKIPANDQAVIREVLAFDPRPAAGRAEQGKTFGAALCGWNVKFRVEDTTCWISTIEAQKQEL